MGQKYGGASRYRGSGKLSGPGLAVVVALHGAAIAAALMAKSYIMPPETSVILETDFIEIPEPTDVPPPQPDDEIVETPLTPPTPTQTIVNIDRPALPPQPPAPPLDFTEVRTPPPPPVDITPPPPPPDPIVIAARFHPQHRGALQPRYPASLLRLELEGSATVRVRIDASGRVTAVENVRADHPLFFEETRRQALRHWRFLPETRDGRPVSSWQVHTVQFRIT